MTDQLSQQSAELDPTQPIAENQTAGQLIRAARLEKGLHMAVLSVTLKVPIRQLEALEANQYDAFKGPVFVRALALSVCRQLQIDPSHVLALLPQPSDRLPLYHSSIAPTLSDNRLRVDGSAIVRRIPVQTVAIAALMLALIGALLWMPSPSTWSWWPLSINHADSEAKAEPQLSAGAEVPAVPEQIAQPQTNLDVAAVVAPAEPVASVPSTAVPSLPVATPSSKVSKASSDGVLGLTATNDSWIEIRNGQNQVLWSRVMHAGESTELQYPLPMNVVIGRAHAVSVTYQGKPFDLVPHTKATVARFEVKE
jgi:cytoskeleton protein RodZ